MPLRVALAQHIYSVSFNLYSFDFVSNLCRGVGVAMCVFEWCVVRRASCVVSSRPRGERREWVRRLPYYRLSCSTGLWPSPPRGLRLAFYLPNSATRKHSRRMLVH